MFLIHLFKWGAIIAGFYFVAMAMLNFFKKKDWKKEALFAGIAFLIAIILGFINF